MSDELREEIVAAMGRTSSIEECIEAADDIMKVIDVHLRAAYDRGYYAGRLEPGAKFPGSRNMPDAPANTSG